MPNAPPSTAIALTRKSGCAQTIAMLIVGSTLFTMPTSPSGATTGLNGRMPALEPAESVTVYSSPTPRPCSASAGTNPHLQRRAEPEELAQPVVLGD